MNKLSKKLIPLLFAMLLMAGMSVAVFAEGEQPKTDINNCNINMVSDTFEYNGKLQTPVVTVQYNTVTLTPGIDYSIEYFNNINVGTAQIKITGINSYTGIRQIPFTITRAEQKIQVTPNPMTVKYHKTKQFKVTGNEGIVTFKTLNPTYASVTANGKVTGKKCGSATIEIKAAETNNYKAAVVQVPVKIQGKDLKKSNTKVTLSRKVYTYNGEAKKPAVRKLTYKGKKLKKNRDFKVKYKNNVNAGTAKVVISGMGQYSDSFEVKFKIQKAENPMTARIDEKEILPKEKAYITVKKAKGDVYYTTSNRKVATVSSSGVVTGKKDGTVTITVTAEGTDNYKRAVKKFKVTVGNYDLTDKNCKVSLSRTSYTYDGNRKTPGVTVKYDGVKLKSDRDYSVRYDDNENAGTASVILKGRGRYKGTRVVTFRIKKADQHFSLSLPSGYIPVGGTARARISGPAIGRVTFGSRSPNYARPINSSSSTFKGYKATQEGITIYARAAGDENHNPYTAERFVPVRED